jgi:type II secretory pathway predicted ATPase ExeA
VLIGEAGTGKTTVLRTTLEGRVDRRMRCVSITNPTLTRDEFVEYLAKSFLLSAEAARSKTTLLLELERMLREQRARSGGYALVVDEAQSLPNELLEEIRLLANIETSTDKLLPVILAGQPELAARLNQPELRQLKQRIAIRCELRPFTLPESASYIAARLKMAGGDAPRLFTREAVTLVHEHARGIARTINVICHNALVTAFAMNKRPVTREMVLEVIRDFDLDTEAAVAALEAESEPAPAPAAAPAPVFAGPRDVIDEPQVAAARGRRLFSGF